MPREKEILGSDGHHHCLLCGSYAGILLHDVTHRDYYISYLLYIILSPRLKNYKMSKFVFQVCLLGNLVPQEPVNGVLGVSLLCQYLSCVLPKLQAVRPRGGRGRCSAQKWRGSGQTGGKKGAASLVVRMGRGLVFLQHWSHTGVTSI